MGYPGWKKSIVSSLVFLGLSSASAYAKTDDVTGLTCEPSQSLWVYELGNRGSSLAPNGDGGEALSNIERWSGANGTYSVGQFEGLPKDIKTGSTYERYWVVPDGPQINLGEFSEYWPTPAKSVTRDGNYSPAPSPESFLAGTQLGVTINTLPHLNAADFDGRLVYFIQTNAQLEYMRLALCSDAPKPAPQVNGPVINNSNLEAELAEVEAKLAIATASIAQKSEVITDLENQAKLSADTIAALNTELSEAIARLNQQSETISARDDAIKTLQANAAINLNTIEKLEAELIIANGFRDKWRIAAIALGGLAALGWGLLWLQAFRRKPLPTGHTPSSNLSQQSQSNAPSIAAGILVVSTGVALTGEALANAAKSGQGMTNRQSKPGGLIFPASPMVAANVPAAGAAATPLAGSQLVSLSGAYASVRPAYYATGRIGFAQDGIPEGSDAVFGTGFLISDRHVMTNRHVVELFRDNFGEGGRAGIEFYAEKGQELSDFVAFTEEEPVFADGMDIAVLTLAEPVKQRQPLALTPADIESLEAREIVVIGYPMPDKVTDELAAVVEENPVFGVKRLSEGQIFRHSKDVGDPFGVDVPVVPIIREDGRMPAVCHNASTTSGSSGSPVLDKNTGDLLGVHFGYDTAFGWAEAANFAMAVAEIQKTLKTEFSA